ncbi:ATP-binding cassette sub-family A member 2, partial [Stegodyphus mimosarum]
MHTSLLRSVTNRGSITLTNAPLPSFQTNFYDDQIRIMERIMGSIFISLALAFLSSSFVLLPTQERTTKAKLLQLMTGCSTPFYWFTMFIWDFFVNFIISLILIIPFAIFSHHVFFSPHSEAIGTAI